MGAGPAFLWPTGTDLENRQREMGRRPTGVVLRQQGPWTTGILANHIWSYADAGGHDRPDVNQTFLQPFVNYTFPNTVSSSSTRSSTYDREGGPVDRPDQCGRQQDLQVRQAARQPWHLYGRVYAVSAGRRAGMGRAGRRNIPVPEEVSMQLLAPGHAVGARHGGRTYLGIWR